MQNPPAKYIAKIAIVGDQGVGKSQLLNRIVNDQFNSESKSTVGVEFESKKIAYKDKILKLQFWDTAGDPKYKVIIPIYFRDSSIMFIVIAGTDKAKKIDQIRQWLETIQTEGINPKIIIIENKIDDPLYVPLDENALATFRGKYESFIRCSAQSAEGVSQIIPAVGTIFDKNPELLVAVSNPSSNANASSLSLATIHNSSSRPLYNTTLSNIGKLNEQQAEMILNSLHNLLIYGPVHGKHYKVNFGKGVSIANNKIGEQNNNEMITVPEHISLWITTIRGALQSNSQNKGQVLSQLYIQINNAANEKPFSRNGTTQDFYQHCLPGFIEEYSIQGNQAYLAVREQLNQLDEVRFITIRDELINHLQRGNLDDRPFPRGIEPFRFKLGLFGGKTRKLLNSETEIKVPDHIDSLLDYLINDHTTLIRDKLIFALDYAITLNQSVSSGRDVTTQEFYDELPWVIVNKIRESLNPRAAVQSL